MVCLLVGIDPKAKSRRSALTVLKPTLARCFAFPIRRLMCVVQLSKSQSTNKVINSNLFFLKKKLRVSLKSVSFIKPFFIHSFSCMLIIFPFSEICEYMFIFLTNIKS